MVVSHHFNTSYDTPWVKKWALCIIKNVSPSYSPEAIMYARNKCAEEISSDLPSLGLLIFTNTLLGSVGVCVFLIFGFNMQLLQDRYYFFVDLFDGRSSKEDEKQWH